MKKAAASAMLVGLVSAKDFVCLAKTFARQTFFLIERIDISMFGKCLEYFFFESY